MPRRNQHPHHRSPDPETRFDHWLDDLVTGTPGSDASRDDETAEQLARAQSGARQLHGLAAQTVVTPGEAPARTRIKERMMHSGALAAPNSGVTWIPFRNREQHTAWWSPNSPAMAGALILAVIVAMAASLFWSQRPALSPDNSPGFAVSSPNASPEDDALSCGAPGYRPLVQGDADANDLAMIGETGQPIVRSDDGVLVPLPGGDQRKLPAGTSLIPGSNTALTVHDDNSAMLTRLSDGKTWEFPAVEPREDMRYVELTGRSRYHIGPNNDERTDWLIVDALTGETTTTADILGEPFEGQLTPWSLRESANGDTLVVEFQQTVAPNATPAAIFTNPGMLVIPGTLDDAYFKTFNTETRPALPHSSPEGNWLATEDGLFDATSGDKVADLSGASGSGDSVMGFVSDEPQIVIRTFDSIRITTPLTAGQESGFQTDGLIRTALYDNKANVLVVNSSSRGSGQWTWMNIVTGETRTLSELGGFTLNDDGPLEPMQPVEGTVAFVRSDGDESQGVTVRALDMKTGEVSSALANAESVSNSSAVFLAENVPFGYVTARDSAGNVVVINPADDSQVTLPPPDSTQLPEDASFRLTISPNGRCAVANAYVDDDATGANEPVGTSYVAPIVPGATWTELDVRITQWLETDDTTEPQTLPAQDVTTPMATPAATPANGANATDLPIFMGEPDAELTARHERYGVIDNEGLTISHPDGDPIEFPGVMSVHPTGVPGQTLIVRDDSSRSVVDLTTGETLFDLPNVSEHESRAGSYLFISESGDNADWTVFDLRTGESRLLAEIVELPADQPVLPVRSDPYRPTSPSIFMHFVSPDFEVSPTRDIPRFLIAGSLDNAITLEGYPPATQVTEQSPVVSPDERLAAWVATNPERAIVVADTATGEEIARFELGVIGPDPQIAGFLDNSEKLVVTTGDRVLLLSWAVGELDIQIIAEGLDNVSNPNLYVPNASLYFREGDRLRRMTIPDAEVTTVLDTLSGTPVRFTTPDSPWLIANQGGNAALIDARTGEVVSQLSDVPPNQSQYGGYSISTSLDGSTMLHYPAGLQSEYHAYLVSPRFPNGLVLTAPVDPEDITPDRSVPVSFGLSPDGTHIVVGTNSDIGMIPRYIASIAPEPEWREPGSNVTGAQWIPMPNSESALANTATIPAQDVTTPMATPEASTEDDAYVTSLTVNAVEAITLSVVVDGEPVYEGELAADESTPYFTGSEFEVYTSSGVNTTFTNACSDNSFNMGYREGEAIYQLRADAESCPPIASAAASPAATPMATLAATPEAAAGPSGLFIVGPGTDVNTIDTDAAIGTLDEHGLTLPVANGKTVTIPDVEEIEPTGDPGRAIITRSDAPRAVVDLTTGAIVSELPDWRTWAQDEGLYHFIPANDALTDWTIVDTSTGATRLLSEVIELPGDTTAMPSSVDPRETVGDARVFQMEFGKIDGTNFVASAPAARTFVIAESLDRAVPLSGFPTARDRTGTPLLVTNADGSKVAYETRAGNDRIIVLDTTTGKVLMRFGVSTVGDDPMLAGFTGDGNHLVVASGDRVMLLNWSDPTNPFFIVEDGLENVSDPMLYVPDAVLYFREADTLMRLDMPTGELTEVATGVLSGTVSFTSSESRWITFVTEDGQTLVDARTGKIVSQMEAPGQAIAFGTTWPIAEGDTFIFAAERPPSAKSAWILSPEFADGLELTVPAETGDFIFNVTQDGSTVFAKDGGFSGSGDLWMAPLSAEPDWRLVAEEVTLEGYFPLGQGE